MRCVGFERLLDYLDGRASEDERGRVRAHLALGCEKCKAASRWYQDFKSVAENDRTVEPPPWVFNRAVRLFEASQRRERVATRVARGVVKLIFDSFQQPAPVGIRSGGPAQRQLLYAVGDFSVDLQIMAGGPSLADIAGQVLSATEPGFDSVSGIPVSLTAGVETVCSASTNDIGEFAMNGIKAGEYDLHVKMANRTISVFAVPVLPAR